MHFDRSRLQPSPVPGSQGSLGASVPEKGGGEGEDMESKAVRPVWGEEDLECKSGPDTSGMFVLFSVFAITKGMAWPGLAVLLKAAGTAVPWVVALAPGQV